MAEEITAQEAPLIAILVDEKKVNELRSVGKRYLSLRKVTLLEKLNKIRLKNIISSETIANIKTYQEAKNDAIDLLISVLCNMLNVFEYDDKKRRHDEIQQIIDDFEEVWIEGHFDKISHYSHKIVTACKRIHPSVEAYEKSFDNAWKDEQNDEDETTDKRIEACEKNVFYLQQCARKKRKEDLRKNVIDMKGEHKRAHRRVMGCVVMYFKRIMALFVAIFLLFFISRCIVTHYFLDQ